MAVESKIAQRDRVEARLNLIFFTISTSLPLLRRFLYIIYIYSFSTEEKIYDAEDGQKLPGALIFTF